MKKVRLFASFLLLSAVLFVGYTPSSAQFEADGCGMCNCYTPNTKLYGVKKAADDSCPACDCYVNTFQNE